MKGFVPTPAPTVDRMIELLFQGRTPTPTDSVLDPGCGRGAFVDGVIRWCAARNLLLPRITCVESDPRHVESLREKFRSFSQIQIEQRDFLTADPRQFSFVIGNPPYVPITGLTEEEKKRFRATYSTARGRFDLYLLFFEQALRNLALGGRIVFITPEKYLYVETASALRKALSQFRVAEISLVAEDTFPGLVTYPTITVVESSGPGPTQFCARDGTSRTVVLPSGANSWMPTLLDSPENSGSRVLADLCLRISCGVATGADAVYVQRVAKLPPTLLKFGRATVSGRQITGEQLPSTGEVMLMPYNERGTLLPEDQLGALGNYLRQDMVKARLLERTCVKHKPWYAFHETPVLPDILRPKILCKDICGSPRFVADYSGAVVPRHSVYYLVPSEEHVIPELLEYLNSSSVAKWLEENSQRAAKGFLRIQSRVLQRLPVPETFAACTPRQRVVSGKVRTRSEQPMLLPL